MLILAETKCAETQTRLGPLLLVGAAVMVWRCERHTLSGSKIQLREWNARLGPFLFVGAVCDDVPLRRLDAEQALGGEHEGGAGAGAEHVAHRRRIDGT